MIKLLVKFSEETRELEFSQPDVTIGRSSENLIPLADKKSSRKHARIEKVAEGYRIVDLDSGNGTQVNGKDIQNHVLVKGDEIKIGLTTLAVLALDGPAVAAEAPLKAAIVVSSPGPVGLVPPAPSAALAAAPVAVAAPPRVEELEPTVPDSRPRITRRSTVNLKRSAFGSYVATALIVIILGAAGYGAYHYSQMNPTTIKLPQPDSKALLAKEADDALKAYRMRTETDVLSESLIAEGASLADKYPDFPAISDHVAQLRLRRAEQIGKMSLAEVETLVQNGLRENRFGDVVEALKSLKNPADPAAAATLTEKSMQEIAKEFKAVDEFGKKLEAEKKYSLAAEHYKAYSPRFKGTIHFKYLSNRPGDLDELNKAELAAARAKENRGSDPIAKVDLPEPAPKETEKAPEPKPAMAPKPAMQPPKPAMSPKPAMEPPKPATTPPPPPPKPAMVPPKPPPPPPTPVAEVKDGKVTYRKPDRLCDCKKIIKGLYCIKCDRTLLEDDVRKGVCKRCEEKPKRVDMCVKRFYQAECHPEKVSDKPVFCDGKVHDFPQEDKSRVAWYCEGCNEWGDLQSEVKHMTDCNNRTSVIKVCLKSGQGAHIDKDAK